MAATVYERDNVDVLNNSLEDDGLTSQAFSAQSLNHSFFNKYGGKLASNCRFRPSTKVGCNAR